jgi:hypothetical protein
MSDSILSLMFPLHGAKKLVISSETEIANEQDETSLEYLNNLSKSSFKKSLILFGENNM